MGNSSLSQMLIERSESFKEPYEFLFKINDDIIVQRYFAINNYNPKAYCSMEFKATIDYCVDLIKSEMKAKTLDFMDEYENFFAFEPDFDTNDADDQYYFQVKFNDKIIMEACWDATVYPAKIRYIVNIKKQIGRIIGAIQSSLSNPNKWSTFTYMSYNLLPAEENAKTRNN